jgi:hypothetical protein
MERFCFMNISSTKQFGGVSLMDELRALHSLVACHLRSYLYTEGRCEQPWRLLQGEGAGAFFSLLLHKP